MIGINDIEVVINEIPKHLENCTHADTSIVVLEIVATCEKTATQCDYCGKILTEPKTDCR
jgi:hypothetical protein